MADHPCGYCKNDACNNGHAFDQKCHTYIEYEKGVLARNIENTRNEFANMVMRGNCPVIMNGHIKRV